MDNDNSVILGIDIDVLEQHDGPCAKCHSATGVRVVQVDMTHHWSSSRAFVHLCAQCIEKTMKAIHAMTVAGGWVE